jgi:biuret amidohydrolase
MQRALGLQVPETLEEACAPSSTALIVYDMQVGILSQIATAREVTTRVMELLQAARQVGMRVVFTRHLSLPRELMGVFQFRMAMAWQRVATMDEVQPWFLRDSPGFPLLPEMRPLPSEAIVDKITMSAFEGTPLNIALRDCGITTFIIAGVAMEIGIELTVRHGADLGYIPVVVTDACGAGHPEAADRSLASLRFNGDALFTTTQHLCDLLREMPLNQPAVAAIGGPHA